MSSSSSTEVPHSRSRRAATNALFSITAFGYGAILSVIITPLLVHGLGATYYGIFALSAAAIGFVGILDFGMGTALVSFLSSTLGRGDEAESRRLIQASAAFYAAVGAFAFVIMILIALTLAPRLFHLSGAQLGVARFALIVSGSAFAFETASRAFSAVPFAMQRYGVTMAIRVSTGTIGAAVSATIILAGFGLRALVGAYAVLDLVGFIAFVILARRLLPGLRIRPRWDGVRIRRLMTLSVWVFVANISAFVIFQFDRLMLGSLASVSAVTYYAVPSSMASYLLAATTSLATVVIPATGDLIARGEFHRVERLYRRSTRLCLLFVGSLGIPAIFFAHPLLSVWLGHGFANRSSAVLQILVLTFIFFSLTVVPYNILVAGGHPRVVGLLNLAIAGVNVILIFALIPTYGAKGAAIAYLVSILLFPLFIWSAERKVLRFDRSRWFAIVWRVLPGLAVQGVVCAALHPFVGANAWLIPALVLTLPLPALVYVFSGLIDDDERSLIRDFLPGGQPAAP